MQRLGGPKAGLILVKSDLVVKWRTDGAALDLIREPCQAGTYTQFFEFISHGRYSMPDENDQFGGKPSTGDWHSR